MPKTHAAACPQSGRPLSAIASAAMPMTGANSYADNAPTNTVLLGTVGPEGGEIVAARSHAKTATSTAAFEGFFYRLPGDAATIRRPLLLKLRSASTTNSTTMTGSVSDFGPTRAAPVSVPAGAELYFGTAVAQATEGLIELLEY
jgi:hypothetical protein